MSGLSLTRLAAATAASLKAFGTWRDTFRAIVLLTLALVASCSDVPDAPTPPSIARIVVTPALDTLFTQGDTVRMTATALDAEGNPFTGRIFTWASDDESIAIVDQNGLVTAAGPNGTVAIVASTDSAEGQATVEIVTGPAGGTVSAMDGRVRLVFPKDAVTSPVQITVEEATNAPADETLVGSTAFAFGPDGSQFAERVELTIQYDPADVPGGVVEADLRLHKLVGMVWQEFPGAPDQSSHSVSTAISGFSVFAVLRRRVADIEVMPAADTIRVAESTQVSATPKGSDGNVLIGPQVSWMSEDEAVATVDSAGRVLGVAAGTATIRAVSESMPGGAATITVLDTVASVAVLPPAVNVGVGATVQLDAEPRNASGAALTDRFVSWSTGDPTIASVDGSGVVTAKARGGVTITATVEGKQGSAFLSIREPVASVTVLPPSSQVIEGFDTQLTYELRDVNGALLSNRQVNWSSSDNTKATVDTTGLVTGVAVGSVTITATSEGIDGTATVDVIPPPVATVAVMPASETINEGDTRQFTAELKDSQGNILTGRMVTWSSDNTTVASVDPAGLVQAKISGSATITALSEGQTGTASVTVVPPPPQPIACGALEMKDIEFAGNVDRFIFTAQLDDLITLTLINTSGFGSTNAHADLVSPTSSLEASFDSDAQRGITLQETGTYEVRVGASNGSSLGQYNLGLECIQPPGAVDAALQSGQLHSGSISAPGAVDILTFAAQSGDLVTITAVKTSGFGSGFARSTLFRPSGAVERVIDSNSQHTLPLSEAGTYVLRINPHPDLSEIGGYNLDFQSIFPAGTAVATLSCGSQALESIGLPGDVDVVTFDGLTGNNVAITLLETGGFGVAENVRARVYSPTGAAVGSHFDSDVQQNLTLPEDGKYVIRLNANNLVTTGTYSIELNCF